MGPPTGMRNATATGMRNATATGMRKSTGCWLLWLRADLPREQARGYWRGPHARRVGRVPGVEEYRQLHFAEDDHGFWPGSDDIGTRIPSDWRIDGMPEVAFLSSLPSPRSLASAIRFVFTDESNAFDRVLANMTGPGGGRWFQTGKDGVGARAVALVRRRADVRHGAFSSFLHEHLGGALAAAPGTLELRTHVFLPYSRLLWPTPGVAHDNPPHRRYHGAVVVGAADRDALQEILGSDQLRATAALQREHCLALHAYAVEETVTVVQDGISRVT